MLCDYVKSHSSMHTFIHSCGSISLLMPDMIDAGIEIFNPVQTNAYRMEPRFLKKEFGKVCTFWGGGIDTSSILVGDKLYLTLWLRANTYPQSGYSVGFECPSCGTRLKAGQGIRVSLPPAMMSPYGFTPVTTE